jgi:RNA polymerase sigma factor (sigma-70 family)
MDQPPVNTVLRHIRKLAIAETARKQSDRDLLREFIEHRDEEAFATIMQRHGGIVMNVIRSVLTREKDAEDVFQVTFFVLAQKVRSIRKRSSLASWLHGVAYRLACKYRTGEARRRAVENQALSQKTTAMDDLTWRELREVLHAEIGRLAEKHRAPLLLCYWGSKTQEEAAAELGWPLGTLKDRLAKARDLLRARLTRRGFELAVPLFATMLSRKSATAAVPELLVRSTVAGAALVATGKPIPVNCVSTAAMALLRGTFKGMLASKLNWALILVFSVGSLALCSALAVHRLPSEHVLSDLDDDVPHEAPSRTDRYGDPLPEGAIAWLGTIRFRNEAGVSRFVLTPDNSTIATMAAKTVTLWETKTGRPRARFTMLVDVDSMALAPDGKMLAVGGRDCILRLLDASSGKEIRQYVGHQGTGDRHTFSGVSGVLFLPGGRALVTWGSDKTIRLWETDTGKELRQFETEDCALWSGDLSSDGKLLVAVCASKSDYAVQLWNVETGRLVRRIPCSDQLARVVFSPDDKRLAATMFKSGQPGKVVLWEVATGKEVGTLVASDDATFSVAFSPDGTALTTGGIDQMIRVWDLASGKERHKIGPLGSSVQQVAFARDGKVLFSSGSAPYPTLGTPNG